MNFSFLLPKVTPRQQIHPIQWYQYSTKHKCNVKRSGVTLNQRADIDLIRFIKDFICISILNIHNLKNKNQISLENNHPSLI